LNADIVRLFRSAGFTMRHGEFEVPLPRERAQTIQVAYADGLLRLSSIVASRSAAEGMEEGPMLLLRQNRFTEFVEFTMDGRHRWIAQTVLPPGKIEPDELGVYVRALAMAADGMEEIVSGKDVY
jgi:hypothetical protein